MTEAQLEEIETELTIKLPECYRRVSLAFPFKPVGNDWVYWMHDEPQRVIYETRFPLEDGEYDQSNWRPDYIVIGNSGAGDLHVMDTASKGFPVQLLSHETHEMEEAWPSFDDFVADWLKTQEELKQQEREREEARKTERKRNARFFIVFLILLGLAFAAMVALIMDRRATMKARQHITFIQKIDTRRITRLY